MVGRFVGVASALPNRDDVRSGFGLSMLMVLLFCRSLMVGEFDRDDVRSTLLVRFENSIGFLVSIEFS